MPERAIRNSEYVSQIKDFSGLWFGSILPTDIDAFLDFQDRLFVFVELKYEDGQMKRGQRLALERLCDACGNEKRDSCLIVGKHDSQIGEEIDTAQAHVTEVRWQKQWHDWLGRNETVRDVIERLLERCDIHISHHIIQPLALARR